MAKLEMNGVESPLQAADASEGAALHEAEDITLNRWRSEASGLAREGAYGWLISRVPGQRILEIGCGFGTSTAALKQAGKEVFVLDNRMDCLEATRDLVADISLGLADVRQYDQNLLDDLDHCWMERNFWQCCSDHCKQKSTITHPYLPSLTDHAFTNNDIDHSFAMNTHL